MEQVLLDEKVPQKNLISDTIIDNLIPLSFETIDDIEKTDYLFQNQLVSVRKSLLDWKHGNIHANTMYEQLSRFGVIYSEI